MNASNQKPRLIFLPALKCTLIFFINLAIIPLISQDTVISNYPGSDQRWEKIYLDDQKIAENIFHENDTPWMTVQYQSNDENWEWFYDDGKPYFKAKIVNNRLQGTYSIWYPNGQLAEKIEFKDNLENGQAEFFFPNGQLAMKGQYAQGKMVGVWKFFTQNGGKPTGNWEWRFAASQENIRMTGTLSAGMRVGQWSYKTTANQGKKNQLKFEEIF